MNFRTHQRVHKVPSTILFICLIALTAVLGVSQVSEFLREQNQHLPVITLCVAALGPILFLLWYATCYADVRRSTLKVKWFWRAQHINLRKLEYCEVLAAGRGKSGALVMRLEESDGTQLWLPLATWRDEDLLMARVLRATVDCRVRIEGDPMLVRRFSRVLDSYKSHDRQLAA